MVVLLVFFSFIIWCYSAQHPQRHLDYSEAVCLDMWCMIALIIICIMDNPKPILLDISKWESINSPLHLWFIFSLCLKERKNHIFVSFVLHRGITWIIISKSKHWGLVSHLLYGTTCLEHILHKSWLQRKSCKIIFGRVFFGIGTLLRWRCVGV